MKEKIDRKLLSKYVNGESTSEDKKYIESVFGNENNKNELQEILKSDWQEVCQDENLEEHDLNHIFYRLYYKITNKHVNNKKGVLRSLWKTYSRIAAVILFPLALAYGVYTDVEAPQLDNDVSYAEINAPLGSRINFTLPDGSSGWLNSGSTLKYPVRFALTRDVELTGEAFFDIRKNKNKPFNVKTSDLNISVLGTKFNVAAYQGDKSVDVVLQSGKVVLNREGSDKFIEMEPDERVVYSSEKKVLKKSKVISGKFTSWKEGKLVFRNDPIEKVAKRLSRWYNVDIEINQSTGSDFRLRATFEDEEIEEVLRLIKLTLPIDYDIEKRIKDADGKFAKRKIKIDLK